MVVAAQDTFMLTPNNPIFNYYYQRLAQLGLTPEQAQQHGLATNKRGEILQYCRDYNGDLRYYIPQFGKEAKRFQRIQKRRTFTGIGSEHFEQPLYITRHTPAQLAADPSKPRYKLWSKAYTGISTLPTPNNIAIQHYKNGVTGGIIGATEGVFKSTSAAQHGLEMSSFSGNTHFKLDEVMQDYLTKRQPDNIVLLLDGDAKDLHGKKEKLSSKRIQGFHNGILKFTNAFFNWCKRHKLKIKLHLAIIQPGQPKGLDDLLHAATPIEQTAIVDAYKSLRTSQYFEFVELYRTTFKKTLQEHFYLQNHQQFYDQFAEQIQRHPFKFNGFWYRCIDPTPNRQQLSLLNDRPLQLPNRRQFKLLDDPFHLDLNTTPLTIQEYVGNQRAAVNQLLQQYSLLAFESPTGSGKTTFFIKQLKRTRQKAVITVPTINLARQLAVKHKICALYGKANLQRKTIALNAKIVVCTYDTLHHLGDLSRRWLIVDEAHNLVNQFGQVRRTYIPFRAKTLRRVIETIPQAQKCILLSGTMNKLLCQALNFHLVKIKRTQNHQINITQLEATSRREQTALLIDELSRLDFATDRIHFVYYNSNEQLHLIKNQLTQRGILTEDDMTIITRDEVNAGQHHIFNEIIDLEQIKSPVKLILSSCLIAEGININNRNIGKVFTLNVRCIDSFRQYVARFRAMKELEVVCITPPETKLQSAFDISAAEELTDSLTCAQLQIQQCQLNRKRILATFEPEELEFMPDLLADYQISEQLLNLIYEKDGQPKVDVLRILAGIRDRQLETGNNCYFFSQLRQHPEFKIKNRRSNAASSSSKQAIKENQEQLKTRKKTAIAQLKIDLITQPELPVYAYYIKAKASQNNHARQFVQRTAPDLIQQPVAGAADYLQQYQLEFTQSWFRQLIRDYLRLHFAGVDPATIKEELDHYRSHQFAQKWRSLQTTAELLCYDSKHYRKHLSPLHRIELKFLQRIKKKVLTKAEDGIITSTLLTNEINAMLQQIRYSGDLDHPIVEQFAQLTTREIENRLLCLFAVEKTVYTTHCEYKILLDYTTEVTQKRNIENLPFCTHNFPDLLRKPLRVLKLYED